MSWLLTPDSPHWVYELMDADSKYLYIGCTAQIASRLGEHSHRRAWFSEVDHIAVTKYANAAAGFAAEAEAIRVNQPKYNQQMMQEYGAPGWVTRRRNAASNHERGAMCRSTMGCKQCNELRRSEPSNT